LEERLLVEGDGVSLVDLGHCFSFMLEGREAIGLLSVEAAAMFDLVFIDFGCAIFHAARRKILRAGNWNSRLEFGTLTFEKWNDA